MDVATPNCGPIACLFDQRWCISRIVICARSALMQRGQWKRRSTESGFSETTSIPGLQGPRRSQVGLMARKAWIEPTEDEAPLPVEKPTEQSWLVFADASGLGDRLSTLISGTGPLSCGTPRQKFAAPARMHSPCAPKHPKIEDASGCLCGDAPPERMFICGALMKSRVSPRTTP